MKNLLDITDRVAIITGGSGGMAAAMARVLAGHGAHLVLAARDMRRLSETADQVSRATGRTVLPIIADVAKEADIVHLVEATMARFGRIDILVNNAGRPTRKPIEEMSAAEWDADMTVNLRSVFLSTREAGRHMLRAGKGAIVNISSLAGVNPVSYGSGYSAAKAALQNFTQATSNGWAARGVRANAIILGNVQHETSDRPRESIASIAAATPMGRLGRAQEVAHAVLFLASDAASFITGAMLTVSGGMVDPQPSAA
jgi:NAD(P)-dependent dehydrogenase (short-subunit alcohol dehydrogenase family)